MSRTTDLQLYEDDLRNQTDQIRELVNSLDKVGGDARAAKVQKAQQLIKTAMSNLHHFKVALRSSNDPDAPRLERRHAEITQQLTQLKEELQTKRTGGGGGGGGGSAASPTGVAGALESSGDPTRDQARDIAGRVESTQKSTISILKKAEQTVVETQEIGDEATNTLAKQTEQMKRINTKLDKMDSDVDRAKKEVSAFMRRMMTDKIIICFALLVLCAIIAVVVLRIQAPHLLGGDATPSATPTTTQTATATATPAPPPTSFRAQLRGRLGW